MINTINREELKEIMNSEEVKVVDVLSREHFEQEHIKGAMSIPLDQIESEAENKLNKDDKIVVYCASFDCEASEKAAKKLAEIGFDNIYEYAGGIKDYKEANLPLEGTKH